MKNKVIYSKISTESAKKYSFKEADTPKLSQSQISVGNVGNSQIRVETLQQKIRHLEEEMKTLREENEYIKGNNIQYCKQINVYF